MISLSLPGAFAMKLGRLRPSFADAVPLVLFTLFFLGNALLSYVSLGNVSAMQEQATTARNNSALIHELLVEVLRASTPTPIPISKRSRTST
jgi:hypothetical protein